MSIFIHWLPKIWQKRSLRYNFKYKYLHQKYIFFCEWVANIVCITKKLLCNPEYVSNPFEYLTRGIEGFESRLWSTLVLWYIFKKRHQKILIWNRGLSLSFDLEGVQKIFTFKKIFSPRKMKLWENYTMANKKTSKHYLNNYCYRFSNRHQHQKKILVWTELEKTILLSILTFGDTDLAGKKIWNCN